MVFTNLLTKYDQPVPRYTSYPTLPFWDKEVPDVEVWKKKVIEAFRKDRAISLYIHLPFCESLCTYCGCNKRITKNHQVEDPYIESVLKEWRMYLDLLPGKPLIREIHLGGGTPTFFAPERLKYLIENILKGTEITEEVSFSFEAHPSSTTYEHLAALRECGFRRISLGVQDFSDKIMKVINRFQTVGQIRQVTQWARDLGYESVNYDLIYGLPFQTEGNIRTNVELLKELRPDRIAFYSYAHVPWIKPSQRAYSEADLPDKYAKRELYELGRDLLEGEGYVDIGLDHFSLPSDELHIAMKNGSLHRNFMGYTPHSTRLSIGLGASSISDTWHAYAQNEKGIEKYQERIQNGEFPLIKGHFLTHTDQFIRRRILDIMCHYETSWETPLQYSPILRHSLDRLQALANDGLITFDDHSLHVTEAGKPFIRNICLALDTHYWASKPKEQLFSKL